MTDHIQGQVRLGHKADDSEQLKFTRNLKGTNCLMDVLSEECIVAVVNRLVCKKRRVDVPYGGRTARWMYRKVVVPLVAGGRPNTCHRMSTGGR